MKSWSKKLLTLQIPIQFNIDWVDYKYEGQSKTCVCLPYVLFFFFLLSPNCMRFISIVVCNLNLFITIIVFILLFENITIYISILLLMDIRVVSCFRL